MSRWHRPNNRKMLVGWRRTVAFLLCVAIMMTTVVRFSMVEAKAAGGYTYALTFTNGENGTSVNLAESIQFIRIKYTADDGSGTHYQYIFPGDGDYQKSLEIAKSYGDKNSSGNSNLSREESDALSYLKLAYSSWVDAKNEANLRTFMGNYQFFYKDYAFNPQKDSPDSLAAYAKKKIDELESGSLPLQRLGYAAQSYTGAKPFQSYANDTLLFTPRRGVKSFDGVEFYASGNGTWSCQSLQIYMVNLNQTRLATCGSLSNQFYIDFSGSLMLEMEKATTFQWRGSSLIQMSTDGGDAKLKTYSGNSPKRKSGTSEYIFRLDIADRYGAGIEALASDQLFVIYKQGFLETLALKVRYKDVNGCTREAAIPVITSLQYQAIKNGLVGGTENELTGIAQQGDTLAAKALLPDFESLLSTQLVYGYDEAMEVTGLQFVGSGDRAQNDMYNKRVNALKNSNGTDTLTLTGISMYSASDSSVAITLEDTMLRASFEGTPLYYYRSQKADGTVFQYGTRNTIQFQPYVEGDPLLPTDRTERYLVVLKTDSPEAAGTTGTLRMKLKYKDLAGTQKETEFFALSEKCKDYYGYWPGVNEDFAYLAGVAPGQELCLVLELSEVDLFNGAEIRLDSQNDEWQMAGLEIYQLEALGRRGAYYDFSKIAGQTSDRRYFRSENVTYQMTSIEQTILIQAGDTYKMDLRSDSTIAMETDDDWSDIRYSMTYEQAKNLGDFTKSRQVYTVTVKVASDMVTEQDYGDCGSVNQFYFQLVFEDGTSAYVLANQQLSSDGFRTGAEETFVISTNRDYGEVTAVRIIPEDLDSKSDVFDKLNVDSITIRKNSNEAVCRQWVVGNVGWIDIDYRDEGAETQGRAGRSEAELARTYSVSYSTDAVNVEFSIATDPYFEQDAQLQGEVTATIRYRDVDGQIRGETTSIDVVRSMYTYMNRTAVATSDPSRMFRGSHTDRFSVSLEDPKELLGMTLYVKSNVQTTWNIAGVSARIVRGSSNLQININDEYERVTTGEVINVCEQDSTRTPAYSRLCPAGKEQKIEITFQENEIAVENTETGKKISTISREPNSSRDTLNIYVTMADDADPLDDYTLKAAAQYTKVYGGVYQTVKPLTRSAENSNTLYALGLNASAMSTLNSLYLKAEPTGSTGIPSARVDHAIVQQVRSGVVINTYYLDFGGGDAYYGCSMRPEPVPNTGSEQQVVSLSFGAGTSDVQLFPEKYDVAVSIRYTTTNDTSNMEYASPYIFLTDQQYNAIQAGKIVDITFQERYVKAITGVTLATTIQSSSRLEQTGAAQNLNLIVDSAGVATYQVSTEANADVKTCTGWYSFANPVVLGLEERTMRCTSVTEGEPGTVSQLTLKFETAKSESEKGSGVNGPISMTIGYTNQYDGERELYFDDIRSYLTSGDFSDGSTAIARFQLSNIKDVRWIRLTPRDNDATSIASWKLYSLTGVLKAGTSETSFARTVDRYFYENEEGTVNVNIQVNLVAETTSKLSGNMTVRKVTNDAASLLAESGQPVTIRVNLTGSQEGFTASAEEVAVETDAGKNVDSYLSVNGESVTFKPPANYSGSNINYRVTIASKEVPSCKSVIHVTVQFEEKPEPENKNDEAGDDKGDDKTVDDETGDDKETEPETVGILPDFKRSSSI